LSKYIRRRGREGLIIVSIITIRLISRVLLTGLFIMMAAAAAGGAQRQYAPDRKVDILHITIDVTPDFKARTITGVATIRFSPIAKELGELRLNAIDLSVSSVNSSDKISDYSTDDKVITITFDPPIAPEAETTVTIAYEAEPKKGLYFRTAEMGYRPENTHLWTQGQCHSAPYWFPNYDYPNERSTSEVICRVPQEMTVLSNGRMVSEKIDPQSQLKVVRWLQDKPHANYLIALVAGKLEKIESRYKDIPLAFYTPASQIDQAQNSFEDTADIMAFFEKEIGVAYPWDKYYQVTVEDFTAGGMENTTLTVLTDRTLFTDASENILSSQDLVAHEMAHQWFGDYVTCKDWSHVWLNEGFATYYDCLYEGHKNGRDFMLYKLYLDATTRVLVKQDVHKPIVYRSYDDTGKQFDYRTYPKAAWVLHTLRAQLGEELYRECIKTYLHRHALGSVVTEDLNAVIEELSGRSFDRFFDQWVYHGGHPDITVSYNWSGKDRLARVSIEQTHQVNDDVMLFHFPSQVRFIIGDNYFDHDITIDSVKHDFYFLLPGEPDIVRFDPHYNVLAQVKFDKPTAMLYKQLDNDKDVIGRLQAIEQLTGKKDKKTISRLKDVLNNDSFFGVRVKASGALRVAHTDEAFQGLSESLNQADGRVRLQVVEDICGFYRPESLALTKEILKNEKNPEIVCRAIGNLGRYNDEDSRELLIGYLKTESYRNKLAQAAVAAIRMLDDGSYIRPLMEIARQREQEFIYNDYTCVLDALAYIARNEDDKTEVRQFISDYVNHPKRCIQVGAITALGTLGDPKSIPVVETFASDERGDRVQQAAKDSLEKLSREKKIVPEEIVLLRETVAQLKEDNKKIKTDLEDLKKRFEAKEDPNDCK